MSRGRPRKPLSEEKLIRKRLAARLRQRRCRERKKSSAQVDVKFDDVSEVTKAESATTAIPTKSISYPPSTAPKMQIVHIPVPAYFSLPPYHPHHHPMYMHHPMVIPPNHHNHPLHPRAASHRSYAAHTHYPHRHYPVMPHHHHVTAPVPYTAAPPISAQSDTIPRTVSRSSSDASADDCNEDPCDPLIAKNKKKRKKSLASEEKTAVAAILSLKSNSSDEESSDETASASEETTSLESDNIKTHSPVIHRVDNAQSVFRAVCV